MGERVSECVGDLVGERASEIEIALSTPPVDGVANGELVRFLGNTLGVARRQVTVERGHMNRHKVVRVTRVTGISIGRAVTPVR